MNNTVKEFIEVHKQQKDMSTYIKLNKEKLGRFNFNVATLIDEYVNNHKQFRLFN